jgi:iron complex outermembrane receptor protein
LNRYTRLVIIALPAVLFSAQSFSQVEEITVSAQRRDANLQEVPISVSAFTVDDMEKLQINAAGDVAAAVPNMQTYNVTANASAMQLFMRGSGVQNPGFNTSESPVGMYIDDVYHGRLATANLDLTDIERTEVLRGPQGTLYGRNTLAGAMKFITRTPDDELWGNASVAYGNYETSKVAASVGGPLILGKLAGSIAGLYHDRGEGWIKRSAPGSGDDLGEYTNKSVRGKLHWYGSENFDAQLSITYIDDENDGYNGVPYGPNLSPPSVPGKPLNGFYKTAVSDANEGYGDTDQLNTALTLTWDLGAWSIKSITSYSDIDDDFGFDLFGGALQITPGDPSSIVLGSPGTLFVNSDSNNTTVTQEVLFSGDGLEDTFHWTAGLFYLNEDGDQTYNPAMPAFFGFNIKESSETETNSYAIYGQGSWDITEKFAITLGARLTRDEKEFDNTCTGSCNFVPGTTWTISEDDTFTEFTPQLLLEYRFNENLMVFGSTGSGFQSGGYQSLCFGNEACASKSYDSETVWNSEIGIKSEFFDNQLRFNASTWYAQYDSIQQTVVADGAFPLDNAGDVDVLGLDIETFWSPNEDFNAFVILGFQNDSNGDVDDLPGLAKTSARTGFNWTPFRLSGLDFSFGLDVEYSDEYLAALAVVENDEITVDDYTRLNGFINIVQQDGPWSVILSGKNLTDEDDNYSGIADSAFGVNIRTPQPPREYMLTAKYSF